MTRSIPTVKYMQANYRKYQRLAVACALLTITASLLAAFSGIRLTTLRKELAGAETVASQTRTVGASAELAATRQALTEAQAQLDAKNKQIAGLQQKIDELERRLTATEGKSVSETPPVTTAPPLQAPESEHAVHVKPSSDTVAAPPKAAASEVNREAGRPAAMPPVQRMAAPASPQNQ